MTFRKALSITRDILLLAFLAGLACTVVYATVFAGEGK